MHIKEKGIPIPSNLSMKTKKLLQMMLMFDHKKRQNCESILKLLSNSSREIDNNQSLDCKSHGGTKQKIKFN